MKNAVSSGVKNLLAFAFMIPTFWLFGWYIYLAFPHGLVPMDMEGYGVVVEVVDVVEVGDWRNKVPSDLQKKINNIRDTNPGSNIRGF